MSENHNKILRTLNFYPYLKHKHKNVEKVKRSRKTLQNLKKKNKSIHHLSEQNAIDLLMAQQLSANFRNRETELIRVMDSFVSAYGKSKTEKGKASAETNLQEALKTNGLGNLHNSLAFRHDREQRVKLIANLYKNIANFRIKNANCPRVKKSTARRNNHIRNTNGINMRSVIRPMFKKIHIAGDGDCLFTSSWVSDMYNNIGEIVTDVHLRECSARCLRKKVVSFLRHNQERFEEFVTCPGRSYRNYLNEMKTNGIWGGEMEIIALTNVLRRDIVTFHRSMDHIRFFSYDGPDKRQNTIYLYYHGDHYSSLIPKPGQDENIKILINELKRRRRNS